MSMYVCLQLINIYNRVPPSYIWGFGSPYNLPMIISNLSSSSHIYIYIFTSPIYIYMYVLLIIDVVFYIHIILYTSAIVLRGDVPNCG